jgi:hypothetical protein
MTCHTIRLIPSSVGKYNVDHNGSTIVAESDAPVIAAAHALKANGVDGHDILHVVSPDCTIADMPTGAPS